MSATNLEQWKPEAMALDANTVIRTLPGPVERILLTGTVLAKQTRQDLSEIVRWVKAEIEVILGDLESLGGALGHAEALAAAARSPRRPEEYAELLEQGEGSLRHLLWLGDFLAKSDEALAQKLKEIRADGGIPDHCQDLRDAAAVLRTRQERLQAVFTEEVFRPALLDEAEALAKQILDAHGSPTAETAAAAYDLRNRLVTLYLHRIEELRAAGQYAFRSDRIRQAPYRMSLRRRFHGPGSSSPAETPEPPAEA